MRIPSGGRCRFSLAAVLAALASTAPAGAQTAAVPSLPQGSVRGTLVKVHTQRSGVIIRDDETGKQMAWKLDPPVVAELEKFKPGDHVWIIYRRLFGGDRAVTAIGFPGTAQKPEYRNATGGAVQLVTGPYVGGACSGVRDKAALREYRVLRGKSTEAAAEPCWCCAAFGQTCEPANRAWEPGDKVTGTIILSRCYGTPQP